MLSRIHMIKRNGAQTATAGYCRHLFPGRQADVSCRSVLVQVLKVIRYSTKFLLASIPENADPELLGRLKAFEGSVGTSRKAFRIGKFLQNVNKLRKQPLKTQIGLLELLSNGGEAVYYFTEQITWYPSSLASLDCFCCFPLSFQAGSWPPVERPKLKHNWLQARKIRPAAQKTCSQTTADQRMGRGILSLSLSVMTAHIPSKRSNSA